MAIDKSSEAYREYMKLAHRADQRLLRLERLQNEAYYSGVTDYAYKSAMRNITDLGGPSNRFRSIKITSEDELMKAKASVTQFLGAPSSTKRGITGVYKKRAASLNATMKAQNPEWEDMTWQELADAWDYIESAKGGRFGYRSVLNSFNKIKRKMTPDVAKELKQGASVVKRIADNKVEEKIIGELLKDVGEFAIKAFLKI